MTCPDCGYPQAQYQVMSGGQEGYCPCCGSQFALSLVKEEERPRATMLRTHNGRKLLTTMVTEEIERLLGEVPRKN